MMSFLLGLGLINSSRAQMGSVSGHVIDENSGEPISRARVYVIVDRHFRWAYTNPDGFYQVYGLPPTAGAKAYVSMEARHGFEIVEWYDNKPSFETADFITIQPGQTTENIDFEIALPQFGAIRGRVFDAETEDPLRAEIIIFQAEHPDRPLFHIMPDPHTGTYATYLPPGSYILFARSHHRENPYFPEYYQDKPTFLLADVLEVTANDTLFDIDFALDPVTPPLHTISGQVLNDEDSPFNQAMVTAVSMEAISSSEEWDRVVLPGKRDTPEIHHFPREGWSTTLTDENGNYTLDIYTEDEYFIMALPPEAPVLLAGNTPNWLLSDPLYVNQDLENIDFSIAILDTAQETTGIQGRVVRNDGEPLRGVRVYALNPENEEIVTFTLTNPLGYYRLRGLEPDTNYQIIANRLGYDHAEYPEIVTTGAVYEMITNIDFELTRITASSTPPPRITLSIPQNVALYPNYPNPFNPATTIPYQIQTPQDVTVSIYDSAGRLIRYWEYPQHPAGSFHIEWDGTNQQQVPQSSGIYIYRLTANQKIHERTMVLLK